VAAALTVRPAAGLRWSWLGVAALLVQIWAVYFAGTQAIPGLVRRVLIPLTFAILLVFALRNWHLCGVRVMAVGFLLNLLVISFNGGLMPISPEEVASTNLLDRIESVQLGEPVPGSKGVLMAPRDARLWFLSDVIVFPPRTPVARAYSAGDLLVLGGLVVACTEVIRRKGARRAAVER
jgi:hypothetical protein